MSDEKDLKDEMKKLKEELQGLKDQLREMANDPEHKHRGIHIDVNESLSDYLDDVMESVAEGIRGELKRSIFVGPHGSEVRIYKGRGGEEEQQHEHKINADPAKAAAIMSALGQEHRLKILGELMSGGKYISELQTSLPEITASTLSSHLDVLQEAGLVIQERVRGRYLITIPGRMAYKMANTIADMRDKNFEI